MRVTEANQMRVLQQQVGATRQGMSQAAVEVTSGTRLQSASDDPRQMAAQQRLKAQISACQGFRSAGQTAEDALNMADSALGSAQDVLRSARDMASQLSSGTQSPNVMQDGAKTVQQLRAALVDLGNSQVRGRYVFGGVEDESRPFATDGAFSGSAEVRQTTVLAGTTVSQPSGAAAFAGQGGGVDVFALLSSLESALAAGDQQAVRGTMDGLSQALEQINQSRLEVGEDLEAVGQAREFVDVMILDGQVKASEGMDVDLVDAISRLQAARTTFEATLQAAGDDWGIEQLMHLG